MELTPLILAEGLNLNNIDGMNISVVGSSHIKTNTECQDFSLHFCSNELGIAVVCDGHGSEKHFRSSKGSEIAAFVAADAIKELMKYEASFSENKNSLLLQLEKNIIYNWNNAVNDHYKNNPFTVEELNKLSSKDKKAVEDNIESAYGSTLIATVLTDKYCFGIQIGDGDCATLDHQGNTANPIPPDDRLQFNVTTSLCDKVALQNFRHFWLETPPVAIVISTDGVRNSFTNENYYFNFCKTVLESFNEMPHDAAASELDEFLHRLTENGSGDDVSVSALYNKTEIIEALKRTSESIDIINTEDNYSLESEVVTQSAQSCETSGAEDINGQSNIDA